MFLSTHSEHFWQNSDILLYLCRFIKDEELVNFATSCRLIYRTTVDRPGYWERQYRKEFCLGDQREQEWFTWYSWYINTIPESKESTSNADQTKQEHLLPATIATVDSGDNEYKLSVNGLPFISNLNNTRWFYAYHWRRQIARNYMSGRFRKRVCQLPVNKGTQLKLLDVNPWYALVKNRKTMAIWLVRHDIFNKKNEHSDKELAFEELTIPLPQLLFKQNAYINSLRRTSRFIVAYASINTYDDVKPVLVGDPIVHLNELEARHIKENKLNNYVALDEQSNMSSTVESPEERKSYRRNAIIVWPNTGTLSPKIIYLRCEYGGKQGSELPKLVDTYGDWVLLQTWYNERLCREYDLIDLNGNQWIKGQIPSHCDSTACIQFASRDQFQFLVWTVMFKSVKPDSNSASDTAQKLQTFGSKNQLPYIKWELFNASKGQSQYEVLLSNQITIPFYPNAIIKAEMYTEKMCLINVFESGYRPDFTRDGTFSASLSLFAFDKSSSNTSAQSLFDARDYGQLLPIDSSDQGRILWTRDIRSDTITPLYSEKLIIVQNHESFEVLDARDGNLVRSITRPLFSNFAPFIGSLCVILDGEHGASWFVDVNTGDTHKPPACIIENQTEGDSENGSLGIAETFPVLSRYATIKSSRYTVSNTVIGRVNAKDNSVYESYTL